MAEIKKYRSAKIEVVANGFIIIIGCQTIVAETPEKLLSLITDYLNDPVAAEKKLFADSMIFGGNQIVTNAPECEQGLRAPTASRVMGEVIQEAPQTEQRRR